MCPMSRSQWQILDNADIAYNWLINPIVQCPSWEANSSLASYEIPLIFFGNRSSITVFPKAR
jgi:hypothetical protein